MAISQSRPSAVCAFYSISMFEVMWSVSEEYLLNSFPVQCLSAGILSFPLSCSHFACWKGPGEESAVAGIRSAERGLCHSSVGKNPPTRATARSRHPTAAAAAQRTWFRRWSPVNLHNTTSSSSLRLMENKLDVDSMEKYIQGAKGKHPFVFTHTNNVLTCVYRTQTK